MTKYNFHLDVIRVLAILGVVAIHVWYPVYSRPDFWGGASWWLAYTINALSRVSVPWFLLVSGALLLPRRPQQEIRDMIQRLVWRLGLPLVFWTTIYFRWDYLYYGRLTYPDQAVRIFLTGSVFHLYFLVILFGLYLLLSLWRRIKVDRWWLGGSFLLGAGLYWWQFFVAKDKTIFNFLTLWSPYLGYFLAGPYFLKLKTGTAGLRLAVSLWLAGLITTVAAGYFNLGMLRQGTMTFWGSGGSEYATNWLSPNVILMSLSGFYFFGHINVPANIFFRRLVASVARASLGIYLVHLLVINLTDKYLGLYLDYGHTHLWWYGSYKFILVLALSYVITAAAVRLPLVRLLWGEKK